MTSPPKPQEIITEIQLQLLNTGEHAFVDLLSTLDSYGQSDALSKMQLTNVLTKSGIFLNLKQLSTLIRAYPAGPARISKKKFAENLKGVLNERRLRMLKRVFDHIDKNGNGKLDYKEMMNRFNPKGHPSAKATLLSWEVVEDRMIAVFKGAEQTKYLTFEDFAHFYSLMSATIPRNDDLFVEILCGVWGITERDEIKEITKSHPKVQTVLNVLKEKIRQKTKTQRGNEQNTLMKTFRYFDINKSETLNADEWNKALERNGVVVSKAMSKTIFDLYAGKDGAMDYVEFTKAMF